MATYTVSSLKQDVRIALDHNNVSTQLFSAGDVDTLTLDELIENKLVDAVREVELNAPAHLLDEGTAFPSASQVITWEGSTGVVPGSVPLPSDFLRLVAFRMSDWDRAVNIPISETDPLYSVQRSRFGGVRGNPQRPVCAVAHGASGLRLEFYSSSASPAATISQAAYIKMPAISSGSIDICEKLKAAAVYNAARLVALATEPSRAEALQTVRDELMA